ncbi:Dopa 4,5-dioxygenase family protein [Candida albicans]|uniref:Dopa 4,5-dioxygenase family protein n=1 Tax=Candida albicans TaxID=5476 RepID=A0A8H6F2W0_CANAX|nr:Dopa 4,5-dioxygenase family protein [Candida albicans]
MGEDHEFYGGIKSYDVHTYYVYKFWEKPIGPHPIRMWELDFKDPEIFKVVVPYFQLNHGPLSVLIHPRTDQGDLKDHTEHALWLGHKVRLDTSLL